MITNAKFKGHGAAVLCLDLLSPSSSQSSSSLLLSGSEDGTARLWDLREHRRRACLCIKVPGGGDVLSAVFAPRLPSDETNTLPNETTAFGRDCSVYLGVENTVLEYDLRNAGSPLILSEPTKDWSLLLQNQDEVNQISLTYYNKNNDKSNNTGAESLYLAACDDSGKIRLTESLPSRPSNNDNGITVAASASHSYETHGSSTILHHDNHGVAVIPACAFRPINGSAGRSGSMLELASGGTDCKIQLWDILRPKKPLSTFVINQNGNEEERSKPQVCNPPFVYSLTWSNNGESLAAGLGDGTVGVFEINNRTLIQRQLLVGNEGNDGTMHFAHESSVASVVYPSFSVHTNDRILCSAGSDGSIVFWDLGAPNDHLLPPTLLQGLRNEGAGTYHTNTATASHSPRILFDISHRKKINWITRAAPSNNAVMEFNDTIFIADTSPEITSYTIPF
eukprot:jgi/Psemu1/254647/estExt_Genewise1Plus.C_1070035